MSRTRLLPVTPLQRRKMAAEETARSGCVHLRFRRPRFEGSGPKLKKKLWAVFRPTHHLVYCTLTLEIVGLYGLWIF